VQKITVRLVMVRNPCHGAAKISRHHQCLIDFL